MPQFPLATTSSSAANAVMAFTGRMVSIILRASIMLSNRFFIKILLCVLSPITLLCTHRKQKSASPAERLV